ncbi:hypothetical protein G7K_6511-t1 [Saitoella complicata NRRL Y-17804]|uniref:Uncharacterized protein n=1 Tax=Saitoella complicata (strain BCRC 22490 / CBS 7301 / JCM 7358 / NBRC 10748 / NRRL Y-17804) TaxID=698492 RepID=A0A0E9NSN0_SAICN|nr:hypothetical protein G7K_6511-t1 [Saitoella complicata NRRL Y-17804]
MFRVFTMALRFLFDLYISQCIASHIQSSSLAVSSISPCESRPSDHSIIMASRPVLVSTVTVLRTYAQLQRSLSSSYGILGAPASELPIHTNRPQLLLYIAADARVRIFDIREEYHDHGHDCAEGNTWDAY